MAPFTKKEVLGVGEIKKFLHHVEVVITISYASQPQGDSQIWNLEVSGEVEQRYNLQSLA